MCTNTRHQKDTWLITDRMKQNSDPEEENEYQGTQE